MAKRRTTRNRKPTAADRLVMKLGLGVFGVAIVIAFLRFVAAEASANPLAGGFFVFLVVAVPGLYGAYWLKRREQRQLQAAQAHQVRLARAAEIAPYHQMGHKEFERALAFLCQRDGCTNVTVVGGAGDLAADVLATVPDGRRILIQAKRYQRGNNVGSPDVQKVGGTYHVVHRAQLAAVVTTSGYTRQAKAYAATAGIRLFDEHALAGWASRTGPAPWC